MYEDEAELSLAEDAPRALSEEELIFFGHSSKESDMAMEEDWVTSRPFL